MVALVKSLTLNDIGTPTLDQHTREPTHWVHRRLSLSPSFFPWAVLRRRFYSTVLLLFLILAATKGLQPRTTKKFAESPLIEVTPHVPYISIIIRAGERLSQQWRDLRWEVQSSNGLLEFAVFAVRMQILFGCTFLLLCFWFLLFRAQVTERVCLCVRACVGVVLARLPSCVRACVRVYVRAFVRARACVCFVFFLIFRLFDPVWHISVRFVYSEAGNIDNYYNPPVSHLLPIGFPASPARTHQLRQERKRKEKKKTASGHVVMRMNSLFVIFAISVACYSPDVSNSQKGKEKGKPKNKK